MSETNKGVSRRSVLKQAAVGGMGLVATGSLLNSSGGDQTSGAIELVQAKDKWFSERAFYISGNKVLKTNDGSLPPTTTFARQIYRPQSAQEISDLIKALPSQTPIACVCGGHESSNASLFASSEAIVLDLARLKSIDCRNSDIGRRCIFQQEGTEWQLPSSVLLRSGSHVRRQKQDVRRTTGYRGHDQTYH